MPSIYCKHIDSECFDFWNCFKCKYKPADIIPKNETKRINEDAWLAIDALESIIASSDNLHQDYLKEKISIVRRCIYFIENFEKDDDENETF